MKATVIASEYKKEVKSFGSAMRFINAFSKEKEAKVPAAPAKDDKTQAAKELRDRIKKIETHNTAISDCKKVVDILGIKASNLKDSDIRDARAKVMGLYPYQTASGLLVKFVKPVKYLANEFPNVFAVTECDWITAIIEAANNAVNGNPKIAVASDYEITQAPIYGTVDDETVLAVEAKGMFVDLKTLKKVSNNNQILKRWETLALYNREGNKAGQLAKSAKVSEYLDSEKQVTVALNNAVSTAAQTVEQKKVTKKSSTKKQTAK